MSGEGDTTNFLWVLYVHKKVSLKEGEGTSVGANTGHKALGWTLTPSPVPWVRRPISGLYLTQETLTLDSSVVINLKSCPKNSRTLW
jgi:hypothetical protein